jgi:hypothetical protein
MTVLLGTHGSPVGEEKLSKVKSYTVFDKQQLMFSLV